MQALFESGRAAWLRNELGPAEVQLRAALALAPGNPAIRAALGAVLLKTGRLNEGFRLFDAWREIRKAQGRAVPELPLPLWRGQPTAGRRLLVMGEDGFGDQIMYARFARRLIDQGAEVLWYGGPELGRLFGAGLGVTYLRNDEGITLNGIDFYCPSSALPLGFDLPLKALPNAPYLEASPMRGPARIGVMTAGNPDNVAGRGRELPAGLAARLLALPGATSLSPAETGAKDFQDTAAVIAGLDLVVSVDTAVAHLAGAMGRPTWVLVPHVADWRWMLEGERTPWYPSARLWRQRADGDWTPVVARLERALEAMAAGTASGGSLR